MIDDQRARHGAEIDQMMPVTVVPGQTRCLQRQHRAYAARANGIQQAAKSRTLYRSGSGAAQILIDDVTR